MDDRTSSADKQKKLASARKRLKQFQQRKTPSKTMESNHQSENQHETESTPHIDDMSTWPNYNMIDGSKLDYSLNGNVDVLSNGNVDTDPLVDAQSPLLTSSDLMDGHHNTPKSPSDTGPVSGATDDRVEPAFSKSSPAVTAVNDYDNVNDSIPKTDMNVLSGFNHSYSAHSPFHEKTTASTEGLQQLSRKINGLIIESKDYLNGDVHLDSENDLNELELRNRELASSVEKLYQENEKLRISNNELKQQNNQLTTQLQQEREVFDDRLRREMSAVKEQLQVHIQTIGILVAEKSELQSNIAQLQKDSEKRLREVEELSGRLKASRTRVNELEREISSSTTSSQHFEKSKNDLAKEVDRLRAEFHNSAKHADELKRLNAELQEKLQAKTADCDSYDQSIGNLKHMVEMKDVLIQQLSNQPNDVHAQALDLLQQERVELVNRLEQYNEAFHQLTAERDHITDQYQTYIDQLTAQVAHYQAQVAQLTEEMEQLSQNLTELRELNENMKEQLSQSQVKESIDPSRLSDLQSKFDALTADYNKVTKTLEDQCNDNQQLTKLVEERERKITDLESEISVIREDTVDKGQLLESIQSDRVSLSRALAQNKELRSQLEELQNAFVKVSNENMELATQSSTTDHQSKQYKSRLLFLEEELDDKIREIDELKGKLDESTAEINRLSSTRVSDSDLETTGESDMSDVIDNVSEHMHSDKEILALESKYMELTKEKAELLDRTERLEHTITQLEGETDTIGEYITRYHHERALLNEREKQKELHLTQLAYEREELETKLKELQNLIAQLIRERDQYKSDSGTVIERRRQHKEHTEDDWPSDSSSGEESTEDLSHQPESRDLVTKRIMSLIEEMGSKNVALNTLIDTKFSPVRCCVGELQVV